MSGGDELDAWLALLRVPGLGPRRLRRLLETCGGAASALSADVHTLRGAGLADAAVARLRRPARAEIERDRRWLRQPGHRLLTCRDDDYPAQLAALADAPAALWLRGPAAPLAMPQVAIVGSRNPTGGGRDTARRFALAFARSGLTVTSGLAAGIDTAAHTGALDGDGDTVAVLGTGADRCYPAANAALAERILAAGGTLVSEFPPGTPPKRAHFPVRNRLISGLSLGVLVVEATLRSGSLITARLAGDQGREVFAVPGPVSNPMSRGCHRLIREGAQLVETPEEVVAELAPALGQWLPPPPAEAAARPSTAPAGYGDAYHKLLKELEFEPASMDRLCARTGLTAEALSSMLLVLELDGAVELLPGGTHAQLRDNR